MTGLTRVSHWAANADMLIGMDNPEHAHRTLTERTPNRLCDDCLAELAGISPRQQVNVIARTLALTTDFDRAHGKCSECGDEKLVTRSLRYPKE